MPAQNWKSILVAVRDPSARKQLAIQKAAALAECSEARLTLLHAFSVPPRLPGKAPLGSEALLRRGAEHLRHQLLALAKPLRARGIMVSCEAVWDFPPAHAVVRHVLTHKPDLVVAESHRHSRLARWFLANSDWELIRQCPSPVWFVKHERLPSQPRLVTAVDPTHAHAKPSRLDDRLLSTTIAAARQVGGRVTLLHVVDTSVSGIDAVTVLPERRATIERLAVRHRLADANVALSSGVPAAEIVSATRNLGADVLIMGAVSRSGLSSTHIGLTAEAVLDGVTCDVLVVKPSGFKTTVGRKGAHLPGGHSQAETRRR